MKIKKAPKREFRSTPVSFRLTEIAKKKLDDLVTRTNKTKTQIIEEMIEKAHKDTPKR